MYECKEIGFSLNLSIFIVPFNSIHKECFSRLPSFKIPEVEQGNNITSCLVFQTTYFGLQRAILCPYVMQTCRLVENLL